MFTMRTSKPGKGNKFYIRKASGGYSKCIKGKPTDKNCDVLSNCVGYACGRFNEIIGSMKYPNLTCNAENFIERAKKDGLKISDKPTLGGIMVWAKGKPGVSSDGAGHVAIVEKIIDKNTIYTSESGWNSSAFWNSTRSNKNGRWGSGSAYSFRGCIVNPSVKEDEKVETPTADKFAIGDKVIINGKLYSSSTATNASGSVKNKITTITRYVAGAKHPYNTTGDLGWMDASSIKKYTETKEEKWTPKVGDYVVPIKLVDYRGKKIHKYDSKYQILQIDSRGAVLGAVRGNQRPVWAVLKLDNIKKV